MQPTKLLSSFMSRVVSASGYNHGYCVPEFQYAHSKPPALAEFGTHHIPGCKQFQRVLQLTGTYPFIWLNVLSLITGSPPSLQSIIIWAMKYCFYLGFQTLRGNKPLKAHILVFKKKKKCHFHMGFPTFCRSICAGLQVPALAPAQRRLVNTQLAVGAGRPLRAQGRLHSSARRGRWQAHWHPIRRPVNRVLDLEESPRPGQADSKATWPQISHFHGEKLPNFSFQVTTR